MKPAAAPFDFAWIAPGLAVGASFLSGDGSQLAQAYGFQAVVDLREEAGHDVAELERGGLALLHLPTRDLRALSPQTMDQGTAFVTERLARGERVLIHCREGIGRSVTLALCVLVDQGLQPLAALEQVKQRRPSASPSPPQYEAWADWLRARHVMPPSFDAFKAIAYRHLAGR